MKISSCQLFFDKFYNKHNMNFLILVKLGTIIVIILTVDESEEMSVLIKPTFVLISDINLMLKISQIT